MMDIFSVLAMFGLHYDIVGWKIGFTFAVYLLFKGYYFFGDLASFIDLLGGLHFILLIMGWHSPLIWVFSIYFLQKALVSFRHM